MNRHTLPSTDQHQQTLLLLPWYQNQSLEQNELRQVESHLRNCIVCRRELVHLRKLVAAVKQSSALDMAAEASYANVLAKLQTTEPVPQKSMPSWFGSAANRHRRLSGLSGITVQGFAVVAASLLLAMIPLFMQYWQAPVAADYYTLSSAKPESQDGPKLRVVFSKSLPNAAIDSLLAQIHGRPIDGPNSIGAYTVRLEADQDSPDLTAAIALLRNQQDVMLVEPVLNQP